MTPSPLRDALARFVFEHGGVRGAIVSLDATHADIMACHAYPAPLARVLAELLAASALLASSLKFDGSLIVQLQGHGPVRLLVVECDARLTMRATAQWTDEISVLAPDADLATLAGGGERGRLAITLDPKDGGPIYQGIVALEASSIATLIEHYLDTSEQIPSRMVIQRDDGHVRGLLLQRLPGSTSADDSLWTRAQEALDDVAPGELLRAADAAALLTTRFGTDDVRLFESQSTRFGCSCTRDRVANALRMVGQQEVEEILDEQGEVQVTCEFCNRCYAFTPDAARALFTPSAAADEAAGQMRH